MYKNGKILSIFKYLFINVCFLLFMYFALTSCRGSEKTK